MCATDQSLRDAEWRDLRAAVILCAQVGVATDKVQADTSSVYTSPQCVAEVRRHFGSLLETPGMKDAAEVGCGRSGDAAEVGLEERADKHFFSISINVLVLYALQRTMLPPL